MSHTTADIYHEFQDAVVAAREHSIANRWVLPLLGFLIMIAMVPPLSATADGLRWPLLAAGLSLYYVVAHASMRVQAPTWCGLALLGWAVASVAWSVDPRGSVDALCKLAILAFAYWAGYVNPSNKPLYRAMLYGLAINSLVAVLQLAGIWSIGSTMAMLGSWQVFIPSGFFINKNQLAEIAVLLAALACMNRWWGLALAAAPSVLLTGSKAAWLAAVVMGANWLWHNHRHWSLCAVMLGAVALCAALYDQIINSFGARIEVWHNTIGALTLFGHGVGSFWYEYPAQASEGSTLRFRAAHAHNDVLELGFELGIVGLILAATFASVIWRCAIRQERIVFIGVATLALVGFPLYSAAPAFLAAYMAGSAARTWFYLHNRDANGRSPVSPRLGAKRYLARGRGAKDMARGAASAYRSRQVLRLAS